MDCPSLAPKADTEAEVYNDDIQEKVIYMTDELKSNSISNVLASEIGTVLQDSVTVCSASASSHSMHDKSHMENASNITEVHEAQESSGKCAEEYLCGSENASSEKVSGCRNLCGQDVSELMTDTGIVDAEIGRGWNDDEGASQIEKNTMSIVITNVRSVTEEEMNIENDINKDDNIDSHSKMQPMRTSLSNISGLPEKPESLVLSEKENVSDNLFAPEKLSSEPFSDDFTFSQTRSTTQACTNEDMEQNPRQTVESLCIKTETSDVSKTNPARQCHISNDELGITSETDPQSSTKRCFTEMDCSQDTDVDLANRRKRFKGTEAYQIDMTLEGKAANSIRNPTKQIYPPLHLESSSTSTVRSNMISSNTENKPQPTVMYTMQSKPLLVPSSCTSKKDTTQPNNILTKSVCLNIPPFLGLNQTCKKQMIESSEVSQTVSSQMIESSEVSQTVSSQMIESSEVSQTVSSHMIESSEVSQTVSSQMEVACAESEKGATTSSQNSFSNNRSFDILHKLLKIPLTDDSSQNIVLNGAAKPCDPSSKLLGINAKISETKHVEEIGTDSVSAIATSDASANVTVVQQQGNTASGTMSPSSCSVSSVISVSSQSVTSSLRGTAISVGSQSLRTVTLQTPVQSVNSDMNIVSSNQSVTTLKTVPIVVFPQLTQAHRSYPKSRVPTSVKVIYSQPFVCTGNAPTVTTALQTEPKSAFKNVELSSEATSCVHKENTELKISPTDMAALVQGKNHVPFPELIQPPGNSSTPFDVYRCVECGVMYSTLMGYSLHVKRISFVISFACMMCKVVLVFFNKCTFLSHLRKHSTSDSSDKPILSLRSHAMSVSSLPDELLHPIDIQHMEPLVTNNYQSTMCSECHVMFSNITQLAIHFGGKTDTCTFEYPCSYCDMELPSSCALKAHLRLHGEKSHSFCARPHFVCPECGLRFANVLSLYQHLFATCMHFSRCVDFGCPICHLHFPSLKILEDHLALSHACYVHELQCLLCKRVFTSPHLFFLHNEEFHKAAPQRVTTIRVKQCHMVNMQNETKKEHVRYHVEEAKCKATFGFACFLCDTQLLFQSREELIVHLNVVHEAYKFSCTICRKGFVTLYLLRAHVLSAHSVKNTKPGNCDMCSCQLNTESALPHIMWHTLKMVKDKKSHEQSASVSSKHSMEISVPKMHVDNSDIEQKKQMVICRFCGHVTSTCYKMHCHIIKTKHVIFGEYSVCPFCQGFRFTSATKFQEHMSICFARMNAGVHSNPTEDRGEIENISRRPNKTTGIEQVAGVSPNSVKQTALLEKPQQQHTASQRLTVSSGKGIKLGKRPMHRATVTKKYSNNLITKTKKSDSKGLRGEFFADDSAKGKFIADHSKSGEGDATSGEFSASDSVPESLAEDRAQPEMSFHCCHLCGLTYSSADSLSSHVRSQHGGEKTVVTCKLCLKKGKKMSLSKMNLQKHLIRKHKVSKPMAEAMVNKSTENGTVVEKGLSQTSTSSTGHSTDSDISASSNRPVKRLRVAEESQDEYVCAKCSFSSASMEDFHNHIAEHRIESSVQCLECGLCFSSVPSLKKHLFMVHKVKKPEAYIEKHDIRPAALSAEVTTRMGKLDPAVEPEIFIKTGKRFRGNFNRSETASQPQPEDKRQIRGKEDSDLVECTVCYKSFDSHIMLQAHMRSHGMAFIRSRRVTYRQTDKGTSSNICESVNETISKNQKQEDNLNGNISKSQKQDDNLNETISKSQKQGEGLNEISESQNQDDRMNETIAGSQKQVESLNETISESQKEGESLNETISDSQKEGESLNETISESKKKGESLNETISESQKEGESLNETISESQKEGESLNETISESQKEGESLNETISESQKEGESLNETISESQKEGESLNENIESETR